MLSNRCLPLLLVPLALATKNFDADQHDVINFKSHLLTPQSMLALPRPGAGVASPDGKWSMSIVNEYDFQKKENFHKLHLLSLNLTSKHESHIHSHPVTLLEWASSSPSSFSDPFWLTNTSIGYLNTTQDINEIWSIDVPPGTDYKEGKGGKGYGNGKWEFEELAVEEMLEVVLEDVSDALAASSSLWKKSDGSDKTTFKSSSSPSRLHIFPPSISPSSIKYLPLRSGSGVLSFSASVYSHISSIYDNEAAEKAYTGRPDAGVVYDELFLREWDTWRIPGKVNQLFLVVITPNGERSVKQEAAYLAPFNASGIYSSAPAPISDSAYDIALSEKTGVVNVALIIKDRNLPLAFHTRQHLYVASVGISSAGAGLVETGEGSIVPAPNTPNNGVRTLTHGEQGAVSGVKFSPSGEQIAWLEMREDKYEADRNRIVTYDLLTDERTEWTEEWDRSPSDVIWSHDGQTIFMIAESQAAHLPYHLSHPGHLPTPLLFNGSTTSLQVLSETHILLSKNTLTSPSEDFVMHLPEHSEGSDPDKSTEITLTQISSWSTKALSKLSLSAPQSFWFRGANNHPVNGWILFPPNYKSDAKYPLAFLIHGGPEGSWADSWSTRWNPQVYAADGYVTVAINPTGSTGYGEAFTRGIRDDWGGKPFKDLIAGLNYVVESFPSIDTDNLFALGGSYGGYMINWIAGHNDGKYKFKALVNHDGVFDTQTMWYTTEQVYFQESENGNAPPWENRGIYQKFNPTNFIQNWNTPTLVIHGGQDFRVPLGESIGAFTALQRKGVPSRFLYFEAENHWVLNPLNSIKWHHEVFRWLDEWKD